MVEKADAAVTELQISPVLVDRFKNGFHQSIQRIFLVLVELNKFFSLNFFWFQNFDPLYPPIAGKPLVLEVLCLEVSVASAGTVETVFDSIQCICDVDMPARVRMGSKSQIFMFFNYGYAHDRNISIFRRRASTVTGNMLIEPKYASVRQSRDSLHCDPQHDKKSRGGAVLLNRWS